MEMSDISNYAIDIALNYGPKFIGAVIVLVLGFWFSNILARFIVRIMKRRNVDLSLVSFIKSFVKIVLKILVIISVMSMVGIAMTSFIAILAAAGLAIGLALQGSLANFAGGILILMFKPFKVGDFIESRDLMGTVKEIQIFYTVLFTIDNRKIIIPNGILANESLTNFTSQEQRRLEWTFGVAYGTDYDKVEKIILDIIRDDERILKEPEPFIGLTEMADSSINIVTRAWSKLEDFWAIHFDVNKKIYKAFNENGIEIPFPQVDVHMKPE
ncbi:MAG: mechanosensitive ion channel [Bacteroidales bacterium]